MLPITIYKNIAPEPVKHFSIIFSRKHKNINELPNMCIFGGFLQIRHNCYILSNSDCQRKEKRLVGTVLFSVF